MDWRDDNQLKRASGAEDRDYRSGWSGTSGAADRPFASPAELRYLPAVDGAIWALLAPLVTVYSGEAEPDARQAPEPVVRALQIARGLAKSKASDDESKAEDGTQSKRDGSPGEATAGRLQGGAAQASTLSSLERTEQRTGSAMGSDRSQQTEADAGDTNSRGAGGEGAEDTSRPRTVWLDVRFPNGYEAAAKAVIALNANGAGEQPFTVLSWAPILRERGDRS